MKLRLGSSFWQIAKTGCPFLSNMGAAIEITRNNPSVEPTILSPPGNP